jgi:lysyl-tRNA synthetase class 2
MGWWDKDAYAARRPYLLARQAALAATRRFFAEAGFVEVETPALQVSPGMEVHLSAFATTLEDGRGGPARPFYLHTSPEFAMKKLLAAGETRLFQLARVFRNAERSDTHHPEFTMLEWYLAGARYQALMDDCQAILGVIARAAEVTNLTWRGHGADPFAPCERLSVAEAFARHTGTDILATAPDPAQPSLALLADAAAKRGIAPRPGDRWDDLFFRIFLEHVEPKLGFGRPTLLYDYPVSMAALARARPDDPRVAERVELYVCGLELANGFGELTDAAEQRRRLERDASIRAARGQEAPIDRDFIAALEHGMPETAGMALGFDRLVMLSTGAAHIEDVLWAPVEDNRN